jgi:starch synthase
MDLIAASIDELMSLEATWTMLGNGEARYEDLWSALARRYPDRVAAHIGFDERLAHHIEAGADAFLMPSRFEPCGLNQMYSLRYGSVPIVRRVGGLADTVVDCQPGTPNATGFVFDEISPEALLGTIRRALASYRDRDLWRALQVNGMQQDLSWDRSAREYVKIYRYALTRGRA